LRREIKYREIAAARQGPEVSVSRLNHGDTEDTEKKGKGRRKKNEGRRKRGAALFLQTERILVY